MAGLGMVWPPHKSKMKVTETTTKAFGVGLATPVWPRGGRTSPIMPKRRKTKIKSFAINDVPSPSLAINEVPSMI